MVKTAGVLFKTQHYIELFFTCRTVVFIIPVCPFSHFIFMRSVYLARRFWQ